jgi:TolB-like protein
MGQVEQFLRRLGQRKIIQWALAYGAAAFALIQVLDIVAQRFAWPESSIRLIIVALSIGFAVTLVLAWYHGERGVQRVSGTELLVLALLLAIGGGWLWRVAANPPSVAATNSAADAPSIVAKPGSKPATAPVAINDQSIAVLPLVNTSGDPANEYFSDGLSDELISVLASVPDLKLIGRNSSFHFKNTTDDIRTIGEKLGVAKLLEGSVRKQDSRVRIAVDLVNAKDDRQLWSQTYERDLKDIFAVQSEIATSVVDQLKLKLAVDKAQPQTWTRNLAAYKALQLGDFYRSHFTLADYRKAVEYYDEAIRLQPDYAVAYARLSRMWRALAAVWLDASEIPDGYARARSAAEQAVRLAPDLGEGYLALAWVQETRDYNFDEAEANVRKALELAPGNAESISAMAYIVASRGRLAEGLDIWRESIDLNPFVGSFQLMGTRILMGLGRLDEAADTAHKAIDVEPSVSHAHTYLVMIDLARGDLAAAQVDADLEEKGFWSDFAHALATQGGHGKQQADAAVQRFIEQYDNIAAFQVASLYALRKEPELMFAALDRAYVNKDSGLTQLLSDPFLVHYHTDPRFVTYCARLKIDCSMAQTHVAQVSP